MSETHTSSLSLSRRNLLKSSGALVISVGVLSACKPRASEEGLTESFEMNAFLSVGEDGRATILAPNPEVGQGVKTSLPMIVAEELSLPWDHVSVEMAKVDPQYGVQFAGGSMSIPNFWQPLRVAGAKARTLLMQAAAAQWGVTPEECRVADGFVHSGSKKLAYGDLVRAASQLPEPDEETLTFKSKKDYTLVGTRVSGVDNEAIATGKPLFGVDQRVPDMQFATYTKCPSSGGVPKSFNVDEIKAMPGVLDAFILEGVGAPDALKPGIAITATSTWNAIRAKNALDVDWDKTDAATHDWEAFVTKAKAAVNNPGTEINTGGDVKAAFAAADKTVESTYTYPFLPHASLEPQNCTAHYTEAGVEIWAPTQTPTWGVDMLAKTFDLPKEKITLHQIRGGGGFGRRLANDYVAEAVAISKHIGAPVKVQWTREDDFADDFYRPGAVHGCKAAIDADGSLTGLKAHFMSFTKDGEKPIPQAVYSNESMPHMFIDNYVIEQTLEPLKVPLGWWRAPVSNAFAFVGNCFLSEVADAAGRDFKEFYLDLLGEDRVMADPLAGKMDTGRVRGVIADVTNRAGWDKDMPDGRGLGLAFYFSHRGYVAEVADVEVFADKSIKVHNVWVSADVGPIINPSGAEHQCVGSVIDGLSTMMALEVNIKDGAIQETNFDQYAIMRLPQTPNISVNFIESDNPPTGLGEPAFPPLAPAVCNAIFAATGARIRDMPLRKSGYSFAS